MGLFLLGMLMSYVNIAIILGLILLIRKEKIFIPERVDEREDNRAID